MNATTETFVYAALAGFDRLVDCALYLGFIAFGVGSIAAHRVAHNLEQAAGRWVR